jgi:hypothetical protein
MDRCLSEEADVNLAGFLTFTDSCPPYFLPVDKIDLLVTCMGFSIFESVNKALLALVGLHLFIFLIFFKL